MITIFKEFNDLKVVYPELSVLMPNFLDHNFSEEISLGVMFHIFVQICVYWSFTNEIYEGNKIHFFGDAQALISLSQRSIDE